MTQKFTLACYFSQVSVQQLQLKSVHLDTVKIEATPAKGKDPCTIEKKHQSSDTDKFAML